MKWPRIAALVSLVPLLIFWKDFQQLFFFHDDWELLNGYSTLPFLRWLAQPFLGEGILPLFKLLWIAALHAAGGGYMAMIVLLWLTHVAIALSFGYLLLRMETPPLAASFAVLMFGLTWTNQETLMWSMQWSAQLALLFFFAAWWLLILILETPAPASGLTCLYTLSVLASGLCSSRNMTGGAVLAVFILLSGTSRRHWLLCGLSLLPGAQIGRAHV